MFLFTALFFISIISHSEINTDKPTNLNHADVRNIEDDSLNNVSKFVHNANTKEHQLLNFTESGILFLKEQNTLLKLVSVKDEKYDLIITKAGKKIYSHKDIAGVSKVIHQGHLLYLTLYTVFTEDGHNRGIPIKIDLSTENIKQYPVELSNTCNPIEIASEIYLVEELNLIKADSNFQPIKKIPIQYSSKTNKFEYLDRFTICGLTRTNKNELILFFSPDRQDKCLTYIGKINSTTHNIVIMEPIRSR